VPRLSIYVSRDIDTDDAIILRNIESLQKVEADLPGSIKANIYIKNASLTPPNWVGYLSSAVDPEQIGMGRSPGAVLIITTNNAKFIVPFGTGHHSVEDFVYEQDFGLITCLNSINPENLKALDKTSNQRSHLLNRTQAVTGGDIFDLALNTDFDLLTAITGQSINPSFGNQITGKDALNISIKNNLTELPSLLDEAYATFQKKTYKKHFWWIDKFRPERTPEIIRDLEAALIDHLINKTIDCAWLSEPEILDWSYVSHYAYKKSGHNTLNHDCLDLEKFIAEVTETRSDLSIELLKSTRIHLVDADGKLISSHSAYRCIYAEMNFNTKLYVFQNGRWTYVSVDFEKEVNEAYQNIKKFELDFPEYEIDDKKEGDYNSRLANMENMISMDGNLTYHGGGHSSIEYCDVIHDKTNLIHVKRGTNSNKLSHLFNQGEVSIDLVLRDSKFREKLNEKLPDELKFEPPEKRPDRADFKVIYAVVSDREGDLNIPFFSKVRLKNVLTNIEGKLGVDVYLNKIEVSSGKRNFKTVKKIKT